MRRDLSVPYSSYRTGYRFPPPKRNPGPGDITQDRASVKIISPPRAADPVLQRSRACRRPPKPRKSRPPPSWLCGRLPPPASAWYRIWCAAQLFSAHVLVRPVRGWRQGTRRPLLSPSQAVGSSPAPRSLAGVSPSVPGPSLAPINRACPRVVLMGAVRLAVGLRPNTRGGRG